ncbi:MAG: STAS domain-containing protein [Gemmatimonadaceae bacterium]
MPSDAARFPPLAVPARLNTVTRAEFRRAALEHVEQAARAGASAVEFDLSATTDVDASGLGILVMVHKLAGTHSLPVRLLHAPVALRQLLELTRLEALFEIESREEEKGETERRNEGA